MKYTLPGGPAPPPPPQKHTHTNTHTRVAAHIHTHHTGNLTLLPICYMFAMLTA